MTTKLYNISAYNSSFTAKVTACRPSGEGFLVTLDQTLFFPEAGGQSCDTGHLAGMPVLHVEEREGDIYHTVEAPLCVGDTVSGEIDFALRYKKMQWHTAEHLLSGAVHRLFGYENVGFHLGDEDMTVDFDGALSAEDIRRAETEMNARIRENIRVTVLYPTAEEAKDIFYRSKTEINEDLRLVVIGEADSCACCAPHVGYTGEIGLAYVTEFMRHKGGTRLRMIAGSEAFSAARADFDAVTALSRLYSVPPKEVADAGERLLAENGKLRGVIAAYERKTAEALLHAYSLSAGAAEPACLFLPFASAFVLRDTAKALLLRGAPSAVVFTPEAGGGHSFAWLAGGGDIRPMLKDALSALGGKGGGSPVGVSGIFSADKDAILAYFEK